MHLNMIYKDINAEEFERQVIRESKIALVKFKASWSGSCQIISPIYNELSKTFQDGVNFFTVDIDQNKASAEKYGVYELPDILFFKNGELVDRVIGTAPKSILSTKLENILKNKK